MKTSFNQYLQSLGYKSYVDYRNRMYRNGFTQMYIDSGWKDIEQCYNEYVNRNELII